LYLLHNVVSLCDPVQIVEEHYSRSLKNPALQPLQKSFQWASTTPQRTIWNTSATLGVRDFRENGSTFPLLGLAPVEMEPPCPGERCAIYNGTNRAADSICGGPKRRWSGPAWRPSARLESHGSVDLANSLAKLSNNARPKQPQIRVVTSTRARHPWQSEVSV